MTRLGSFGNIAVFWSHLVSLSSKSGIAQHQFHLGVNLGKVQEIIGTSHLSVKKEREPGLVALQSFLAMHAPRELAVGERSTVLAERKRRQHETLEHCQGPSKSVSESS